MSTSYPQYFSTAETLPRDQLRQLQEVRLLTTLARTWEKSPLFKQLWTDAGVHPRDISSIEDFEHLAPCFDKDDIRRYRDLHSDPCGGLFRLDDPDLTTIVSTSGTTGDPTPLAMRLRTGVHEGYVRDFWHMGMRPGDYIAQPVFTFRGGVGNGFIAQWEAGFIPLYFSHEPAELPRLIEGSKRFRPVACGLISSPLILAFEKYFDTADDDPREVFSSYKGLIYGGEALSPRLKKLTDDWGLNLFETTGLGDMMSGTQCSAKDGFHAYEDLAFVECLHPVTNEPVADGDVGELVVTNIHDPFLAMVRFRTDDLVTLNREPCSCGRTHLRYDIQGRKSDQILVQGKAVLPKDIRYLVEARHETAAGLFQIIRTGRQMDVLAVRVGYNPERLSGALKLLGDSLAEELGAVLEIPVRIELVVDDELLKLGPPHKIPRVTKQ